MRQTSPCGCKMQAKHAAKRCKDSTTQDSEPHGPNSCWHRFHVQSRQQWACLNATDISDGNGDCIHIVASTRSVFIDFSVFLQRDETYSVQAQFEHEQLLDFGVVLRWRLQILPHGFL